MSWRALIDAALEPVYADMRQRYLAGETKAAIAARYGLGEKAARVVFDDCPDWQERNRQLILRAVSNLQARGARDISLTRVAKVSGFSRGCIRRHFGSAAKLREAAKSGLVLPHCGDQVVAA